MLIVATVTISLPDQIAQKIDAAVVEQGFATRSEFVRSILRNYFAEDATEPLVFEEFEPKPLAEIRAEFEKTGKYSEEFIDSLIKGLASSSVYREKTAER